MKTKHTQGEWSLADNQMDKKYLFSIISFTNDGCKAIADTYFSVNNVEQCKANAKLIAAAPELLEALKELMEGVNGLPPLTAIAGTLTKQYKQAEQAINKATS